MTALTHFPVMCVKKAGVDNTIAGKVCVWREERERER